jgi:hypothetical protein
MSDFLFDTEEVTWGREGKEKSLAVRGLSTSDLSIAIKTHRESLEKLFGFAEGKLEDGQGVADFGFELLDQFPDLIADLIALAADKPDLGTQIKKLPAPVQLKLAEAVYRMTIEDTGGLQDFLHQVFTLVRAMRSQMPSMSSQQVNKGKTGT